MMIKFFHYLILLALLVTPNSLVFASLYHYSPKFDILVINRNISPPIKYSCNEDNYLLDAHDIYKQHAKGLYIPENEIIQVCTFFQGGNKIGTLTLQLSEPNKDRKITSAMILSNTLNPAISAVTINYQEIVVTFGYPPH